jgi:hypothetical protein
MVRSSGSTLLHFAATNDHTNIVGAKVLVRENGMEGMAEMLTEWLANMDQDLSARGRLGWILPVDSLDEHLLIVAYTHCGLLEIDIPVHISHTTYHHIYSNRCLALLSQFHHRTEVG